MESLEYQEIYITYFNDVYKYTFSLCKNKDIAEEVSQRSQKKKEKIWKMLI